MHPASLIDCNDLFRHFFISKHEALGKADAEVVARSLEALGFLVWLSRDQADVDEAGAVNKSKGSSNLCSI